MATEHISSRARITAAGFSAVVTEQELMMCHANFGGPDDHILKSLREQCLSINFSEAEMEVLTDQVAYEVYSAIRTCLDQQHPHPRKKPVALSMEVLGKKVLEVALDKFYERVG